MAARGPSRVVRHAAAGFTLVELLAVILIIGILMAMVLGVVTYAHRANLEAKAKADIETIRTALVNYQMDLGKYPDNVPPSTAWTNALIPHIRAGFAFTDPWGQRYVYRCVTPFKSYTLYSKGADRAESTPETNADNIEAGRF